MATRYVDVNADAGGDGTTNALTGGTCAYKSLNIWEAARQGNLAAVEECVCGSNHASTHTADTTAVDIDGWTTSSSNYIYIHTDAASAATAPWSDTKYRLVGAGAGADPIWAREDYIRIKGLQIDSTGGTYGAIFCYAGSAILHYIWNCHFKGSASVVGRSSGAGSLVKVWNCVRTDSTYTFIDAYDSQTTVYASNCSACDGSGLGYISNSGTLYVRNSLYRGGAESFYQIGGTLNTAYCASDDTYANNWGATGAQVDVLDFKFSNDAGNDWHLASDSPMVNGGTDLSADTNYRPISPYDDDMDGNTRSSWDIGAFEYVAVGPASILPLVAQGMHNTERLDTMRG